MLSDSIQKIGFSPTLKISAKAQAMIAEGIDVVDLSVGEPDFPAAQVQVECAREGANVPGEFLPEVRERAGEAVQFVHRGVARVAAGVVFFRPAAAGDIKVAQPPALVGEVSEAPG